MIIKEDDGRIDLCSTYGTHETGMHNFSRETWRNVTTCETDVVGKMTLKWLLTKKV
jgi:hypothetical protein